MTNDKQIRKSHFKILCFVVRNVVCGTVVELLIFAECEHKGFPKNLLLLKIFTLTLLLLPLPPLSDVTEASFNLLVCVHCGLASNPKFQQHPRESFHPARPYPRDISVAVCPNLCFINKMYSLLCRFGDLQRIHIDWGDVVK